MKVRGTARSWFPKLRSVSKHQVTLDCLFVVIISFVIFVPFVVNRF